MNDYMLLLYDSPTAAPDLSPEEMQKVIQKYRDWADHLEKEKRYVAGNKLRDGEGRVMKRVEGRTRVLDGPYSETKEVVGGFITISAESYEDAVRVAEGCPHLAYGGSIEVRAIDIH